MELGLKAATCIVHSVLLSLRYCLHVWALNVMYRTEGQKGGCIMHPDPKLVHSCLGLSR